MSAIHIGHLALRYRLPSPEPQTVRRLNGILCRVLAEGLPVATASQGAPAEILCIRELHIMLRLDLRTTDASLMAAWSLAIVDALGRAQGNLVTRGAVRYTSRWQAVCDALRGFAQDDPERSWAWQRMGILPQGMHQEGIVSLLTTEARTLAALLAEAGRQGWLTLLLGRLAASQWADLASAALMAAGVSSAQAMSVLHETRRDDEPNSPERLPADAIDAEAARQAEALVESAHNARTQCDVQWVLRRSTVLRAAHGVVFPTAPLPLRWAVAVLAALEVDPSLMRRGAARMKRLITALMAKEALGETALARSVPRGPALVAQPRYRQQIPTIELKHRREVGTYGEREAPDQNDVQSSGPVMADSHAGSSPEGQHGSALLFERSDAEAEDRGPAHPPRQSAQCLGGDEIAGLRPVEPSPLHLRDVEYEAAASLFQGSSLGTTTPSAPGLSPRAADPAAADATLYRRAPAQSDTDSTRHMRALPPPAEKILLSSERARDRSSRQPHLAVLRAHGDSVDVASAGRIAKTQQQGATQAGGLLFLLALLGKLGLVDEMTGSALLLERPLRWSLHQLALTLQPLAPADPAALAFAGLRPQDPLPTDGEPPATAAEKIAIGAVVERLTVELRRRLDMHERPEADLYTWLCMRPAHVIADPGWFEIHFAFTQVDSTIRGAGLDVDPGYLPLLGIVVVFRYV